MLIERWRQHYDTIRPYNSLGYRPPAPETRREGRPDPAFVTQGLTAKSILSITTRSNLNSGIVRGGRSIDVTAVLGTSLMPISQILKLGRGAVVELNRGVGENIEILSNGRLVDHGEDVVVEDTLAVSVTDIIKSNID